MFKVGIRCFTYNHAQFIEDALNGFVIQKTDFPFVAVIVDDASTDHAPQIIADYVINEFDLDDSTVAYRNNTDFGTVYFARHKKNENCFFAVVLLNQNHFSQKKSKWSYYRQWINDSEYLALCEGDDFWTDSSKLQKQVSFLESHQDFVLCSHNYTRFFQDTQTFESSTYYSDLFKDASSPCFVEYSLDNYFDRWWTQPLTCMYRNGEYLRRIPKKKYRNRRDDIFYYYVLKEGKGGLLRDSMGVYRIHQGGVWSGKTLIQRYESTAFNAYNIYSVEGDLRTFRLIDRMELKILETLFNERCYWSTLKRLICYRKKAPKTHFRSVKKDFGNYVLSKTKRKIHKVFKF